jgi:hypothetical protein
MRFTVHQWYSAVLLRGVVQGSCLLWTGSTNHHGYGTVRVPLALAEVLGIKPRTPALVHRAIYAYHHVLGTGLVTGTDPLDHKCCNRTCYKLSHLRQVSHAVNQQSALEVRMYGKPSEWEEEHSEWF